MWRLRLAYNYNNALLRLHVAQLRLRRQKVLGDDSTLNLACGTVNVLVAEKKQRTSLEYCL